LFQLILLIYSLGAARACPGRFFAEEVGLAMAAALLWSFNLEPVDKNMTLDDIGYVDAAIW
jgi:hypothetical protein